MRRLYTEAQAIAILEDLGRRWPPSLWLYAVGSGGNGSLLVFRSGEGARPAQGVDPSQALAQIDGISVDGGDI